MKASLQSVRLAPKKANLIALMVRGMNVPEAVEALRCTNKKGARLVEKLLLSAMANASHNEKQDPQTMIIKTIVVNQGTAFRRGMPKARGQTRPYRKFLSHIDITLGFPGDDKKSQKKQKSQKIQKIQKKESGDRPSQKSKDTVKKSHSSADAKKKTSSESSPSSESSASS